MSWRARIALTACVAVPSVLVRASGAQLPEVLALLVFGGAVVAAAFLLAGAAEAGGGDISGNLAVAILALIAVLPEFAVDLYFAFTAGHRPSYAPYAAANMTGSNRLLIGFGWSLAAVAFVVGVGRRGGRARGVDLKPERRIELAFLGLASIYAVVIPLTRQIAWYDSIVLIGLFATYMWRVGHTPHEEPDLIGVAGAAGRRPVLLPRQGRQGPGHGARRRGQPVDAAGRGDPAGVHGRRGRRLAAARPAPARRVHPHQRPGGARLRGPRQPAHEPLGGGHHDRPVRDPVRPARPERAHPARRRLPADRPLHPGRPAAPGRAHRRLRLPRRR